MKSFISVLLVVCLLFTGMSFVVNATEDDTLTLAVASDVHLNVEKSTSPVKKGNSFNEDFFHAGHSGQMPEESAAIADAFFDTITDDESEVLLIPGDIADTGLVEQHIVMAEMFATFEAESGKDVYVVPGNHDLYETSLEQFKEIYADFGYADAIAVDTLSASYVVDLDDDYRLLAIDSTNPGQSPHGMTQERVDWIATQCKQAKEDGKKVIAMMHHNLIEHFVLAKTLHKTAIVNGDAELAEALATNGVKYIFTGHTHDSDIAAYTAEDGSVIYDVVTAALFSYPCPYRIVTFSDTVTFETRNVTSVDASLLPPGITENAIALAQTDMVEYSKICTWIGVRNTIVSYTKASSLKNLLNLDKEKDAQMCEIVDKAGNRISEFLQLPLYIVDAAQGEMSVESYLAEYGVEIPASEYADIVDIAVEIFQAHVTGDEYFPGHSAEVVCVVRGLAGVLHYAFEELTPEEYSVVLSYIADMLNVELPASLLQMAGDAVSRMRGLELFFTTAIMPLICEYTVDDAPADNNVTLAGYSDVAVEVNFFQQIIDFFRNLFDALLTFFAHFFG